MSKLKAASSTGRWTNTYKVLNPAVEEYQALQSLPHRTPEQETRMDTCMEIACGAALRMCDLVSSQTCRWWHLPTSCKDQIESDCAKALPRIISAWRPQPSDKDIPEEEHQQGRSSVSAWTWWCLQRRAHSTASTMAVHQHNRYRSCWGLPLTSSMDDGLLVDSYDVSDAAAEEHRIREHESQSQSYSLAAIAILLDLIEYRGRSSKSTTLKVVEMRLDGLSYTAIARILNRAHTPKFGGKQTPWDEKSVDNVLARMMRSTRKLIAEKKWKILAGEFKTLVEASTYNATNG